MMQFFFLLVKKPAMAKARLIIHRRENCEEDRREIGGSYGTANADSRHTWRKARSRQSCGLPIVASRNDGARFSCARVLSLYRHFDVGMKSHRGGRDDVGLCGVVHLERRRRHRQVMEIDLRRMRNHVNVLELG